MWAKTQNVHRNECEVSWAELFLKLGGSYRQSPDFRFCRGWSSVWSAPVVLYVRALLLGSCAENLAVPSDGQYLFLHYFINPETIEPWVIVSSHFKSDDDLFFTRDCWAGKVERRVGGRWSFTVNVNNCCGVSGTSHHVSQRQMHTSAGLSRGRL